MAFTQQDPNVSDADALSFLKYNPFSVKDLQGAELVTAADVRAMVAALGSTSIAIGDDVLVRKGKDTPVEGEVLKIRYVIKGFGNTHVDSEDVEKK